MPAEHPQGGAAPKSSCDVLVINPNTTQAVTQAVAARAQKALGARARVHAATAAFGGAYIASETSYAVGAHAVLDAYARHAQAHGAPHAVLVACFGDPGVLALRSLTDAPIAGLAEAAMVAAQQAYGRYAIVTGGPAWVPMLTRFARMHGLHHKLACIEALSESGADLAADPARAVDLLVQACDRAAAQADGVILGGAGLAPLAAPVRARACAPMIDSVEAGLAWLLEVVPAAGTESPPRPRFDLGEWLGFS